MNKKLVFTLSLVMILSLTATGAVAQDFDPPSTPTGDLPDHVPGEVLISFYPWVDSAQEANKMAEMGVSHKRQIPAIGVHLVKLPPGLSVEQAIQRYSHLPGVAYAEPNYILQIEASPPKEIVDQWGLNQINAEDAWSTFTVPITDEILLATIDTGIDRGQSDLAANMWENPGEIGLDGNNADKKFNGIDDDDNGYVDDWWGWDFVNNDNDPLDDNMHGTAVSSVMVAVKDNSGMAGVCPWCHVMSVKVMGAGGTGTLDVVANGIVYATDNGAQVINLSLSGAVSSATLENAVNHAWNQGTLVVAAAGNDGLNTTRYPAAYDKAMAVGSTNSSDNRSCFSNFSENYISVAAPGEAILVIDINNTETGYGYYSGTSLSAPHVAGLGGLLLSQNPAPDNNLLRLQIENTAVDLGQPGFDAVFGYGRIDAHRAVIGDNSETETPVGLFSTNNTASGYAHARKLVRDSLGTLHMIWHTQEGSDYQIRYASSSDNGANWNVQDIQDGVFSSNLESYHPALATDDTYLYVAIPSRSVSDYYQILFTRKPINGGEWSTPQPLMGGTTYHAVRPDIFVDPSNGRLHLVASSLDDAPYIYYLASGDKGISWDGQVVQVNPTEGTPGANSSTRYATIHANGNNVYIATRTVGGFFIVTYYLHTVRSTDGGQTWFDQFQAASFQTISSGEFGISLAGVGDQLYMAYELWDNIYFRRFDGSAWSDYELLESNQEGSWRWPSITQAADGQSWLLFEESGQLFMRHYDGATWEAKENVGTGSYANFKLGTNRDQLEWIATQCNGAPFLVSYDSRTLGANNPPTASFSYNTTNLAATFNDTSTDSDGTIISWAWDFGDSSNSSTQNPTHSYATAGTYTVSLTVTDNDGSSDTTSQDITVTEPPNANPTASFSYNTTNLTATFTDISTDSDGTIISWAWDFGDTNSSTAQNPWHIYAAAGTYTVSLTVTDNDGGSDTTSQDITVTEPPNVPPTASFSYNTTNLTATFTDASTDSDGTIASWAWDFGDENSSTAQNPVHTYTAADTYTVSLTVTDDDGAEDSVSQNVTVTEPPNLPPTASFSYSTDNLTATFTDTSTDSDGTIASWLWNFGDGNSSTMQNPEHTYTAADTYTVSLTVTDDDGAENSVSQNVTVTEPPNVPPTASFSYNTTNLTATFTDASTDSDGTIASWAWDFGDSSNLSAQNPAHSYAAAGTYTVSLTVTDNDGGSDTTSQDITVTEPPILVDAVVTGEIFVAGTVSGDYTNTYINDGAREAITERDSGGKPIRRFSYLEHKWTFEVTPGNAVTLYANAWSSSSSDGDSFVFAYSPDDANYTDMFIVSNTSDAGYVAYGLPASIQGTVYVRVSDSDHTAGNRDQDTVFVDHLYIRSETQPGDPPAALTSLIATAVSAGQIDLAWIDNSDDEFGFKIERSLDGSSWSEIATVGGSDTGYSDTDVTPIKTYYYRVRAYNASGSSDYSNVVSATTQDGLSLTATGRKVKGVHVVDLEWSGSAAILFYIYRDGKNITLSSVSGTDYSDNTGNKGGASYQYQVCEAGNPLNCSNTVRVDF